MTQTNRDPEVIIKFVEKLCGRGLYEREKNVIRKLYSSGPEDRYLVMCRHHGRATIMDLISDFHEITKI